MTLLNSIDSPTASLTARPRRSRHADNASHILLAVERHSRATGRSGNAPFTASNVDVVAGRAGEAFSNPCAGRGRADGRHKLTRHKLTRPSPAASAYTLPGPHHISTRPRSPALAAAAPTLATRSICHVARILLGVFKDSADLWRTGIERSRAEAAVVWLQLT